MHARPRSARSLVLFTGLALWLGACATVRPHERENLARRSMIVDEEPGEGRFRQHRDGSREGADGGTAHPGGGCGCN